MPRVFFQCVVGRIGRKVEIGCSGAYWAEKWTSADVMTIFLLFTRLWAENGRDDLQRTCPPSAQ